jgi:sugar lactone lactonase YvrE
MRGSVLAALLAVLVVLLGGVPAAPAAATVGPSARISTLAGDGATGFAGDGGAATAASLDAPRGRMERGPDGSLYFADTFNNRIRRIAPDGRISTVAGNGRAGDSGDGGPAVAASLYWPHDVAVDPTGDIYIADSHNNRIRRVTRDGIIRTVVGTGRGGYNGDGIPATRAQIYRPKSVVPTTSTLYFSDGDNNRIRSVDLVTGLIRTIAGTGQAGYSGDGGPATRARLNAPRSLARTATGDLVVADSRNHAVRWIDVHGRIHTVAGTGVAGFSGDGGRATAARLNTPRGVALGDGDRTLYIADAVNDRVRQVVLTTGVITTVVGDGAYRFAGDGGTAARASISRPHGVTVDRDGSLLIADTANNRIRRITA